MWFGLTGRLVNEWLLDVRLDLSFVTCEMSGFGIWRFSLNVTTEKICG